MKMAAGQIALEKCPHVSPEGRAALESASRPPIQLVEIGSGENQIKIGNETQLFRHEEKFHRPTAVAIRLDDTLDDATFAQRAGDIGQLVFERVGTRVRVNMVAVDNQSQDAGRLAWAVQTAAERSGLPCMVISAKAAHLDRAAEVLSGQRPLLYVSDPSEALNAAAVAKARQCPLAIRADGLEALAELTPKIQAAGVEQIVLAPGTRGLKATLDALTRIRRLALKGFRRLGYPALAFAVDGSPYLQMIQACTYVAKYAAIVILDTLDRALILPVLATRQDIYTDPQKPVAVEPKLYEVGEPGPNSPVLVTTNFSLTYYSVEGEVEASRVPAYILSVDTEGTSVLTAWASDKFNPETIAKALHNFRVEERVKHRRLVIPGLVAVLSAGIEDESGWTVQVGPKEASGIPNFLKTQWQNPLT